MNYRIILLIITTTLTQLVYGQAGTLDPTYADNAEIRNISFFQNAQEVLNQSVTDDLDRTWIAGQAIFEGDYMTLIARLDADGNLDTDFSDDGYMLLDIAVGSEESLRGITLIDNDLLLLGSIYENGMSRPYLIKLKADGNLDLSFGADGIAQPPLIMNAGGVAIDDNGNFYVAGSSADHNVLAFKLFPDGEPDLDFGAQGIALADFPSTDHAVDIDLDEDGNIYLFGYGTLNGTTRGQITAFTSDGESNSAFTPNSRRSITWPNDKAFFVSGGYFNSQENSFYIHGRSLEDNNGQLNCAMVKVGIDSEQDMNFSSNGWLEIDLGLGADDQSNSILEGPEGSYLSATVKEFPEGLNSVVLYIDHNGEAIPSFGNQGIATFNVLEGGIDQALSLSFQSNGNLILTGVAQTSEVGMFGYAARVLTSNPLNITDHSAMIELSVFPNPATDYIQISGIAEIQGILNYRLLTIQGQAIKEGLLSSTDIRIDVHDLPQSSYILKVDGFKPSVWIKTN